ncbi:MAG: hypothetical protein AB7K41_02680 [Bdellovibrionales bacterium]
MKTYIYILCFLSSLWGGQALAASQYKQALDKKLNAYLSEGVVTGGRAGKGYSLLNVRRDLSTKMAMERVILDLGDLEGKPLAGKASYFQASIEKNPPRIVIDLAQLSRSAVTEAKLKQIFKRSPYIKSVELTSDPEDRSASLVLALNEPMAVEVFEMPSANKATRIVLDLKKNAAPARKK